MTTAHLSGCSHNTTEYEYSSLADLLSKDILQYSTSTAYLPVCRTNIVSNTVILPCQSVGLTLHITSAANLPDCGPNTVENQYSSLAYRRPNGVHYENISFACAQNYQSTTK